MFKKLLLFIAMMFTTFTLANDKVIKVAAAGYPMNEIVKIAAGELEKKGYKVEITLLTDYVTANKGLEAGDFDANFHQHEPFMGVFNERNNGHLVKVVPVYDVYVGFYSTKYKNKASIPNGAKVAIPNDPTNQDRALRILAKEGLISLKSKNGLYNLSDVNNSKKNLQFMPVPIPSLVQAYKEVDLAFNWPSHMLKIGVHVKDALFTETGSNKRFSIILASRQDNKNSQKIKDLAKAMTSASVKKFLKDSYSQEGYPVF
ncbi:MetQ/NlpA family ABC transporter substrate-binding protein [Pseudostreptobacillus hongkongensis]|uniref:MetQ/NlpA family ABC transporter substrate-binding protein n=1 Tax=Pseudostreptobacillus hongkongensis TaxID=1162717 RepID=UPI0028D283C7|nr:MetQ/NlpA family ABC transporter substrate-binding protein [Pseudostreptobacillus hongkongensis]